MGFIGLAVHGIKGVYGMVTGDWDLVDEATEKARLCLYRSVIDPVGLIDVADIVEDAASGDF